MRPGVGVSPGNVAVYYGVGNLGAVERKVKVVEVVLRCLIFGLGVLSAALVASDTQVRTFFTLEKKAKFTSMKSLVFLVTANGIVAGYSLVQGVRCVVSLMRGSVLFNKPLAWAIFSCDQVMAYLTLAAVAAALQSAMIGKFGQPELQWMKICNLYGKYCTQVGEGIASAMVASFCMVTLSCVSAFNLFRLYGSNKGKCNGSW
ncbi:CASP-like protein 2B1 [Typha latifolia]|uniref:CASP-like protein 2B1 n=1 Tax=Typha latifolia TaxID=4733 RepID=UPI003C2FBB0D